MENNKENRLKIKRVFITILLVFISFLLQGTLLQNIRLAGVIPNILLLIVVFISFLNGLYFGIFTGLFVGVLLDFMYGSLIGINMLAYLLIGYLVGMYSRLYRRGNYIIPIVMIIISEGIYGVITYVTDYLLRGRLNIAYYFGKVMVPECVYTIVMGILIYGLVCFIYEDRELKGGNIL